MMQVLLPPLSSLEPIGDPRYEDLPATESQGKIKIKVWPIRVNINLKGRTLEELQVRWWGSRSRALASLASALCTCVACTPPTVFHSACACVTPLVCVSAPQHSMWASRRAARAHGG